MKSTPEKIAYSAKWARDNPEKVAIYKAKYAQKPEARERKLAIERARSKTPEERARKAKWRDDNREAINQRARAAWRAHGQHQRRSKRYGVTKEWVEARLAAQGGCAICKTTVPTKKGWVVDHDHKTKAARGILCGPCNSAIGMLRDNAALCHSAAFYLGSH